jgi:GAF domain-containing protein
MSRYALQLATAAEVSHAASSILDPAELLPQVVNLVRDRFNFYYVGLFLLDEGGEYAVLRTGTGEAGRQMLEMGHKLKVGGTSVIGRCLANAQPCIAPDMGREAGRFTPLLPETRLEMALPLISRGQVIGAVTIQSTQSAAIPDKDITALQTMADQLANAIQNARLFGEAKQRLEEMTALYQTALEITAQLEMPKLLKSIVERAVTLLQAEGGGICLYDPKREELRWDIGYGYTGEYVGTTLKPGEGMAGKVFQTGEPLIVDDYRTWEGRSPIYEADKPFTAALEVPLKWQERIVGVLAIHADAQKRTFNQDDIWLATLFANQAAVAIENARIYEEERKRITQLELIGGITQKVASILNLDELLPQVVHLIRDTFGYYYTSILLVEADGHEITLRAVAGLRCEALIGRLRLKIGREGITGWVAHSGEPLLVSDVSREPRYYLVEESRDTRSELAVPIKLKGETIGVLDVQNVELDALGGDDVSILQTLADQLAIAIENARLYEAQRQQLHRLEELAVASQRITADLDLASVLEKTVTQALTTLEADRAAIFLKDGETDRVSCAHSIGLSSEYIDEISRRYLETPESRLLDPSAPVHILDRQTDPATQDMREAIVREGYHTFALLPLISKGKVLGALAVYRDDIRAFRPEELALAQSFANQAAVAIVNARLHQEIQRWAEELTFLNRVGRAVTSSLDLEQVLVKLMEETSLVLKTEACSILLLDEESSELVFEATGGPQAEKVKGLRLPLGKGIAGWVAREGRRLLVPDVREDPRFCPGVDEVTGFVTRSVLAVPLEVKGKVIGVIEALNKTEGYFSQTDVSSLSSIARWAAIAIENAQSYQQTDLKLQIRLKELSALYAMADMVNRSLDLHDVLQLALDSAIAVAGMDSGGILLLDPSANELFLRAHRGCSPELIRSVSQAKADEGLAPRMLNSVLTTDDLSEVTEDYRIALEKEGLQSLLSIPLQSKGSLLGVMVMASHSPRTLASQELLVAIGNQVGVAVDRANLQAQKLRAAILEERQDIARQMHDDIAQTLGYLGLQVDGVMNSSSLIQNVEVQAELEEIRRVIENAYERVHSSIMQLREDIPDHFDWAAALSEIINEFEKQTGCSVELRVEDKRGQPLRLPPPVALQVTYIIREALANVRKHSAADSVHLTVQGLEEGMIEVTIQDNGRGFELDRDRQSGWGGFGLRFMRERAELAGGSLRVESGPGQGTRVVISLPSG